jgi:glycogen debranching enzyme
MAQWARALGETAQSHERMLAQSSQGFVPLWNERLGSCFDVLDGPEGKNPSLQPNRIFAVSLRESGLTAVQQRAVADACVRGLLTSFGWSSLVPSSPAALAFETQGGRVLAVLANIRVGAVQAAGRNGYQP